MNIKTKNGAKEVKLDADEKRRLRKALVVVRDLSSEKDETAEEILPKLEALAAKYAGEE